jgi:hypothetical protein
MSYQEQRYTHPSHSSKTGGHPYQNMPMDASSTFVKPLHDGSSQSTSVYTHFTGTAIPPPPAYLYPPLPSRTQRSRGYLIAIAVLALMVVGLSALEVFQLAGNTLLAHDTFGSMGSNRPATTSARHATELLKTTPVRTLTPGTIKENILLTCGVCDDPVLTTINSITFDTTNLRMIWSVKLYDHSGAQQIDYFNDFSLQDPSGNTYDGTGDLNTPFSLSAGQIELETEIFSFLPRPAVPYTLVSRLSSSGITYDPVQFTF